MRRKGAPRSGRFGRPGACRVPVLVLLALCFAPGDADAQSARAEVQIRIPPIVRLDVAEPVEVDAGEPARMVEVRVRANQDWALVVAAPPTCAVRVRVPEGDDEYRLVPPGSELALAAGEKGMSVLRVEYRWPAGVKEPPSLDWRLDPR